MVSVCLPSDALLQHLPHLGVGYLFMAAPAKHQWRNNSRKNEGMEPKQKQYPRVDVTGDKSKIRCCKEQYCIGTWNVRSMNQGKLEVVKQEMATVIVNILGVSKLKWTGMGNLTQRTIISTAVGKNPFEEME